jgi:hypothetical protein
MGLSVDSRKILEAEVVPFEEDEGIFGIAWTTESLEGADKIGFRSDAERLVCEILSATRKQ